MKYVFLLVLTFSCFGFSQSVISEYTVDEINAYFKDNIDKKESLTIIVEPYAAPDYEFLIRSLIDRDWFNKRRNRIANQITFGEPFKVITPFKIDDDLLKQLLPSIEKQAEQSTARDIQQIKEWQEGFELESLSERQKEVLEKVYNGDFEKYRQRSLLYSEKEMTERYHNGDYEKIYADNFKMHEHFLVNSYVNYFLMPVFYKNDFEGYLWVNAEKKAQYNNRFQLWHNPLQVTYEEAQSLLGNNEVPVLYDLSFTHDLPDRETLFWVSGSKVVGAGSGAVYELVDEQMSTQNLVDLQPQFYNSQGGYFALETTFNQLTDGIYISDSSRRFPDIYYGIPVSLLPLLLLPFLYGVLLFFGVRKLIRKRRLKVKT